MAEKSNINKKSDEEALNNFNIQMRSQPWFIQWMQERGLNPSGFGNRKLSGKEQDQLEQLVAQHYFGGRLPEGMTIDSGSSLNQKGGWAGMPTWAKTAIIAGAAVATAGTASALSGGSFLGIGGGAGAVPNAVPAVSGSLAPVLPATPAVAGGTAAATGTAAAAGGKSVFDRVSGWLRNPVVNAAGQMISAAGQASANNRGVNVDAQLAHDDLALRAARERRDAEKDAYAGAMLGQLATSYQPSNRPAGAEGRHAQGFISDGARVAGQTLYDQMLKRLQTQDYGTSITPFSELPTQPGRMERFATYAGPALSLFDPRTYGR